MTGEFRTQFVKEVASPAQRPALVLNADYRPLSYYPLSLWSWQDAVKAAWLDRVQIVAEYDDIVRHPQPKSVSRRSLCCAIMSNRKALSPLRASIYFCAMSFLANIAVRAAI